jgi:hypothetical protein
VGLRFQKRLQVFPGVRLNFSRSGVSATIGIQGASVTVGRDGVHANTGLPGSGLSYRKKITGWGKASTGKDTSGKDNEVPGKQNPRQNSRPRDEDDYDYDYDEDDAPAPAPAQGSLIEGLDAAVADDLLAVESAPLEQVASAGLEELRDLIDDAGRHRRSLKAALAEARHAHRRAEQDLKRYSVWWRRWLAGSKRPALEQAVAVSQAEVKDLQDDIAACVIDLDLDLDPTVLDAFIHLAQAFDELQAADVIWDITASRNDGRLDGADVQRVEVDFFFADSALLKCKMRAMLFGNANGADMHIYPAFVLLRDSGDGFALVDPRDLVIGYEAMSFVEDRAVPEDTKVIGDAWEQVTRVGDRDRRFKRNNRMLPKVLYGSLSVYSREGLNERWLVSNAAAAERFSRAWVAYQKALPPLEGTAYGGL